MGGAARVEKFHLINDLAALALRWPARERCARYLGSDVI
jgi:hypothetical protein